MNIASISDYKNKVRKLSLTAIFLIVAVSFISAQTIINEKPPLKERLFFGGSIALQFGTATDIEILPVAGIWLLPRVAVAVGPGFRFYSYQGTTTVIYSVRSYLQFVPIRDISKMLPVGAHTSILLQIEDEALSLDAQYWHNVDREPNRFWVNTIMAGPGISQQMGRRSALNILVLWTLNNTGYDIYSNPIIRIGFVF